MAIKKNKVVNPFTNFIETGSKEILVLKKNVQDLENKHFANCNKLFKEMLGDWYVKGMVWSNWNCEGVDNPVGVCVYDDENDPDHDSCIFCNDPSERK